MTVLNEASSEAARPDQHVLYVGYEIEDIMTFTVPQAKSGCAPSHEEPKGVKMHRPFDASSVRRI
jgi:hypothetical protein